MEGQGEADVERGAVEGVLGGAEGPADGYWIGDSAVSGVSLFLFMLCPLSSEGVGFQGMLTARRNTLGDIQQMLRDKQETMQVAAAITASLRSANPSIRVAHSIYEVEEREDRRGGGGAVSVIAPSDIEFDFDDEVVSGRAYRRVLAQARATVNNNAGGGRGAGLARIDETAPTPPATDRTSRARGEIRRRPAKNTMFNELADNRSETLTVVEGPSPPPPRGRASRQPFPLEPRPLPETLTTRSPSPPGLPWRPLEVYSIPPLQSQPEPPPSPRRGFTPPPVKSKAEAEIWQVKSISELAANQPTVRALRAEYLDPTRQSRLSFAWGSKSKRCERPECNKPLPTGRGTEAPHLVVQVAEGRQFHKECFRCWLVCLFPLAWPSSLGRY